MSRMNIAIIVIGVLAAIVLLLFLNIKNRRDKKELLGPEGSDPMEEVKMEQQRGKDNI